VCNVEQIGFLSTVARSCRQTPRLGSSPKAFGNGISAKRFRHMSPRLKEPSGQPFGAVILYFSGSDFVSFADASTNETLPARKSNRATSRRPLPAECHGVLLVKLALTPRSGTPRAGSSFLVKSPEQWPHTRDRYRRSSGRRGDRVATLSGLVCSILADGMRKLSSDKRSSHRKWPRCDQIRCSRRRFAYCRRAVQAMAHPLKRQPAKSISDLAGTKSQLLTRSAHRKNRAHTDTE
jgi:hypothetical protein